MKVKQGVEGRFLQETLGIAVEQGERELISLYQWPGPGAAAGIGPPDRQTGAHTSNVVLRFTYSGLLDHTWES